MPYLWLMLGSRQASKDAFLCPSQYASEVCLSDCLDLQAGGHVLHLALAMYSPSRVVQVQALNLIKVVSPFFGDDAEQHLIKALDSLPGNAMQPDVQCESSDSTMRMP